MEGGNLLTSSTMKALAASHALSNASVSGRLEDGRNLGRWVFRIPISKDVLRSLKEDLFASATRTSPTAPALTARSRLAQHAMSPNQQQQAAGVTSWSNRSERASRRTEKICLSSGQCGTFAKQDSNSIG
jgi:hypothetical protein